MIWFQKYYSRVLTDVYRKGKMLNFQSWSSVFLELGFLTCLVVALGLWSIWGRSSEALVIAIIYAWRALTDDHFLLLSISCRSFRIAPRLITITHSTHRSLITCVRNISYPLRIKAHRTYGWFAWNADMMCGLCNLLYWQEFMNDLICKYLRAWRGFWPFSLYIFDLVPAFWSICFTFQKLFMCWLGEKCNWPLHYLWCNIFMNALFRQCEIPIEFVLLKSLSSWNICVVLLIGICSNNLIV